VNTKRYKLKVNTKQNETIIKVNTKHIVQNR
jgi:hypothetical protein